MAALHFLSPLRVLAAGAVSRFWTGRNPAGGDLGEWRPWRLCGGKETQKREEDQTLRLEMVKITKRHGTEIEWRLNEITVCIPGVTGNIPKMWGCMIERRHQIYFGHGSAAAVFAFRFEGFI